MEEKKYKVGQIVWADLTTNQAGTLKEFYKAVLGWQEYPVAMKDEDDGYDDYAMLMDDQSPAGGICNSRGQNANLPATWIPYIYVEDVEGSLAKSLDLGGKLIHESKKKDGTYNYVIVQDPAGAVFGFGKMQ
ncbi:VOC family protein [Sphingobacterium lactis]|uniref:VOC family protein n=1 Tax=Sphingobacterium lactis TaxID=797291 RepID=UPI003EC72672